MTVPSKLISKLDYLDELNKLQKLIKLKKWPDRHSMKKDSKIPVFNQYETISPATKLLQKRRKMYEIHEAFEHQKDQFKNQQVSFKIEEDVIKTKDKDLQTQLTKFCQFLQQNQSKRKKAEEKSKFQEKAYLQKEEQLRNLQKQIEELTKNQKKYMNRVVHLRKYQDFLQKVRSTYTDQYPQMSDILSRYQTLRKSTDDLIRTRQKMEHSHQVLKKETNSYEKQMNQSILTINNEIKEISRRIQDKSHQKNEVQAQVERSNQEYSNKNLNLGKIFMAIDNLSYRANQNSYRVKYEFDEKGNVEKKQIKIKKIEEQTGGKNQEDKNYEQRSKHAGVKLKNIVSHMKDLKAIIDEYRSVYYKKGDKY